jgi:hypothetical protein
MAKDTDNLTAEDRQLLADIDQRTRQEVKERRERVQKHVADNTLDLYFIFLKGLKDAHELSMNIMEALDQFRAADRPDLMRRVADFERDPLGRVRSFLEIATKTREAVDMKRVRNLALRAESKTSDMGDLNVLAEIHLELYRLRKSTHDVQEAERLTQRFVNIGEHYYAANLSILTAELKPSAAIYIQALEATAEIDEDGVRSDVFQRLFAALEHRPPKQDLPKLASYILIELTEARRLMLIPFMTDRLTISLYAALIGPGPLFAGRKVPLMRN